MGTDFFNALKSEKISKTSKNHNFMNSHFKDKGEKSLTFSLNNNDLSLFWVYFV